MYEWLECLIPPSCWFHVRIHSLVSFDICICFFNRDMGSCCFLPDCQLESHCIEIPSSCWLGLAEGEVFLLSLSFVFCCRLSGRHGVITQALKPFLVIFPYRRHSGLSGSSFRTHPETFQMSLYRMLVLWKVAQRRYCMFFAVYFLLICCKRFGERVSFKGLCDILEGGKIWKQRQMKGVLGQRWNFLLSNFPLALLSSPAAWWEILSRKKQWVSTHILSATLCLSCWYLWYFYHHLLILLPLPSKSVQGSSSQIPPLLLSPNMPECIRQDLWLNWDHPWIGFICQKCA